MNGQVDETIEGYNQITAQLINYSGPNPTKFTYVIITVIHV